MLLVPAGFICSFHGSLPGDAPQVLGGAPSEACRRATDAPVRMSAIMAARYTKKACKAGGFKDGFMKGNVFVLGRGACSNSFCLPVQVLEKKDSRVLQTYASLEVCTGKLKEAMYYNRTMARPREYAAKLHHVAQIVGESTLKTVVLIRRNSGRASPIMSCHRCPCPCSTHI